MERRLNSPAFAAASESRTHCLVRMRHLTVKKSQPKMHLLRSLVPGQGRVNMFGLGYVYLFLAVRVVSQADSILKA
jgi:hypothetical protein